MSIDEEAQRDLALTDDDAANVMGGLTKKGNTKQLKAVTHATAAAPMIKEIYTPTSVTSAAPEDVCDDPSDPSSM